MNVDLLLCFRDGSQRKLQNMARDEADRLVEMLAQPDSTTTIVGGDFKLLVKPNALLWAYQSPVASPQ